MLLNKLKSTVLTLLALGAVATGAGFLSHSLATMKDEPKETPAAPPPPRRIAQPERAEAGRMVVAGRVIDSQGKPVTNAMTMLYTSIKQPGRADRIGAAAALAIGQARSDGSGLFQMDAPRISSSTHHESGVVAIAPGYGAGWVELDVDSDQPIADITLRPEQVIHGRLFDVQGQPAQGVKVWVEAMGRAVRRNPPNLLDDLEGPQFWGGNYRKGLPAWPGPTITDTAGRFSVRGVGQQLRARLMVDDPRFAQQRIEIDTDGASDSKSLTIALEPAKIITGRVTYVDSGKPVPHAMIKVTAFKGGPGYGHDFEADAQGFFRANPLSTDRYSVSAYAPAGSPYLNVAKDFAWTKGALAHQTDLALPRGVAIRGRVTEERTGRPVAGAMLGYLCRRSQDAQSRASSSLAGSGTDGSFRFAVLPIPGYITVLGPSEDFWWEEYHGNIRNGRFELHGIAPNKMVSVYFLDPERELGSIAQLSDNSAGRGTVTVRLEPCGKAKARLVDPAGKPLAGHRDPYLITMVVIPAQLD